MRRKGQDGQDGLPVVLIYQMGKVGSTSVWQTIVGSDLAHPVYKVHYLSDRGVAEGRKVFSHLLGEEGALPHAEAVDEVRGLLTDDRSRWKVISLVRDPIARDVSSYVQLVHFLNPELTTPTVREEYVARTASAQFALYDEAGSYQSRWFDLELKETFGIDVFDTPFDHQRRRLRIQRDNVDVLVLRVEDLNDHLGPQLAEFLEVEPARIRSVFASSRHKKKKAPAYDDDVYRRIVSRVRVPRGWSKAVYASRLARHFYTERELGAFAHRWDEGAVSVKQRVPHRG